MKRMQLWGAVFSTTCLASVAFAAECGAEARALMPSNGELAAMCPGEPLFNKAPSVMGSKTMCHYDYGAPGAAGMAEQVTVPTVCPTGQVTGSGNCAPGPGLTKPPVWPAATAP